MHRCRLVVVILVTQSRLTLRDPVDCSLPRSSVHTGVGSHYLLQGIFPTQGSNLGLLHCRQILYHLSHQGSPDIAYMETYIITAPEPEPLPTEEGQSSMPCHTWVNLIIIY